MTYTIQQRGKAVGTLVFGKDNIPQLSGSADEALQSFVSSSLKSGITRLCDIHTDSQSTIVEERIDQSDTNFPLAFIQWLQRHGYNVELQHPEADERIRKLTDALPKGNELREKILQTLPTMSYLEKTFILKKLEESLSK